MTPNWVTLVVAGLGFLGTLAAGLGGVLITQRGTNARDRQLAKREEAARTFQERRSTYAAFMRASGDLRDQYLNLVGETARNREVRRRLGRIVTAHDLLADQLQLMFLYGSPDAVRGAQRVYKRVGEMREIWLGPSMTIPAAEQARFEAMAVELLEDERLLTRAMRTDFGI